MEEVEEAQEVELCPGNAPCPHRTTPVRFLKTSCHHFLTSDLKYQHLRPPSPEVDYVPIKVELREKESRALLEVHEQRRWGEHQVEEEVVGEEKKGLKRRRRIGKIKTGRRRRRWCGGRRRPAGSREASLPTSQISLLVITGSIAT